MTHDEIAACFTGPGGSYAFARWTRPIVPVVFGVDDATLAVVKGAIEAVVASAGHKMAETDPEQGANLFLFFVADWSDVAGATELDGLVPGITGQAARLEAAGVNQYRQFRFETDGAIRACFAFLRMNGALGDLPATDLALTLAVQVMLLWSDGAFAGRPILTRASGSDVAVVRPEITRLIRAAYDPILPSAAREPSHALRLAARMGA